MIDIIRNVTVPVKWVLDDEGDWCLKISEFMTAFISGHGNEWCLHRLSIGSVGRFSVGCFPTLEAAKAEAEQWLWERLGLDTK